MYFIYLENEEEGLNIFYSSNEAPCALSDTFLDELYDAEYDDEVDTVTLIE